MANCNLTVLSDFLKLEKETFSVYRVQTSHAKPAKPAKWVNFVRQKVRQNKFSDKSHAKGHAKNIFDSAKIIEIKQFEALQVMKFKYFL